MFRQLYPGIRTRLTLPFLIVILIVGGVSVFIVTRLVAGSIEERIANQLRSSAQSVSNATVEVERQYLAAMRAIAFTDGVVPAITSVDNETLERLINSISINESLDDTLIVNASGQVLLRISLQSSTTNNNAATLPDVSSWQSVQRVLTGQSDVLGDKFVEIQQVDGVQIVYFAAPIRDNNNIIVGGVLSGVHADKLVEYVAAQSLSDVTIYRSDGTLLGTSIERDSMSDRVPVESVMALNTQVNQALPIAETEINGLSYEVLYAPFLMRDNQIGIMEVALQTDFVVEQISVSRDSIALIFILLIASVAFIGLAIARSITNPVAKMVHTTRLIRLGDLDQRVNLRTPDELGELAQSFDSMTEKLIKQNQRIKRMYKHQLRENAQRDAVLSSIGDAVFVLNNAGRNILSNHTAELLIDEIHENEIEYREFRRLMRHPDKLQEPRTIMFAEKHFSVLATPVILRTGYAVGHVVVLRDISDLIEAEQLKDELINQLSHELRTPLTAAVGYAQLVEMFGESVMNDQSKEYIGKTIGQLNILTEMINQVISVSAMLRGDLNIDLTDVDLVDIVEEAIESQRRKADESDVEIIYKAAVTQLCIDADSDRLREAIAEIIDNAITYTLPGGAIRVTIGSSKNAHIVRITDTGVGILPDELTKVFDRLYRGRSANAGLTDNRGLGIGLFIAQTIVEAHNGQIQIESKPNKGTRVTVALPRN